MNQLNQGSLTKIIKELNAKLVNLNSEIRANCFNAVQLFWSDTQVMSYVSPEKFVSYTQDNFSQIKSDSLLSRGDLVIIWSRTDGSLPLGGISFNDIYHKRPGYPYGLIIEHAFIVLDDGKVLQKADPSLSSTYEVLAFEFATLPYVNKQGYELTFHRRKLSDNN